MCRIAVGKQNFLAMVLKSIFFDFGPALADEEEQKIENDECVSCTDANSNPKNEKTEQSATSFALLLPVTCVWQPLFTHSLA